jgi:hypothetical protein
MYLIQISQTLENSNSHESQKTCNIMKFKKLIKKLKAQRVGAIAPRWKKTKRPNFLHKRNKWTQSDNSIETDGVATHCCE